MTCALFQCKYSCVNVLPMPPKKPRKGLPSKSAAATRAVRQVRPGGRSARVHASVLEAAFAVLTEKGLEDFAVADVAARAGVHETSIYRRWGTRTALAVDACLQFAEVALPIPNTGSLRSDLVALLRSVAGTLASPQGRSMLALTVARDPSSVAARRKYWQERFSLARAIFDRAVSREEFPVQTDPIAFLELLIAPLYFRLLVTAEPIEEWQSIDALDQLLRAYQCAPSPRKTR